jgi:hypothetical protein
MFLKIRHDDDASLVEVQDPHHFEKADLFFPSGEALPRCWVDSAYQAHGS